MGGGFTRAKPHAFDSGITAVVPRIPACPSASVAKHGSVLHREQARAALSAVELVLAMVLKAIPEPMGVPGTVDAR